MAAKIHMADPLEREKKKFQEILPTLTGEDGKYAVVCGDDFLGTFASYEDALKVGYERCGASHFLVQLVSTINATAYFTRDHRVDAERQRSH